VPRRRFGCSIKLHANRSLIMVMNTKWMYKISYRKFEMAFFPFSHMSQEGNRTVAAIEVGPQFKMLNKSFTTALRANRLYLKRSPQIFASQRTLECRSICSRWESMARANVAMFNCNTIASKLERRTSHTVTLQCWTSRARSPCGK
jgi:hypothetical protein